jgi:hypothetical protein
MKSLTGLNYCSLNYSLFLILSYWRYDLYSINWWMSYLVSHIVVTTVHHDILIHTDNFFMLHIPRYIWNTYKVGVKHQSIIQSSNSILSRRIISNNSFLCHVKYWTLICLTEDHDKYWTLICLTEDHDKYWTLICLTEDHDKYW